MKLTQEEFEKKVNLLFPKIKIKGNYVGTKTKVLASDEFGDIMINPDNICHNIKPTFKSAVNKTEYFKELIKAVKGDVFNLDSFEYVAHSVKSKVICKFCNDVIYRSPLRLLQKEGCPNCSNKKPYTTESFIEKCRILKESKNYDYSLVNFKNINTKITLICPQHGNFSMKPNCFLNGQNCPKCSRAEGVVKMKKTKIDSYKIGWSYSNWQKAGQISKKFDSYKLYIVQCQDSNKELFYKIGKTYKKLSIRLTKGHFPYNYLEVLLYEGTADKISKLEKNLQNLHKEFKYIPKKEFGGMYECFSQINLKEIKNILFNVGNNSCC